MAVNFPQNPEIDDSFESRGVIYSWDGTRWVSAFQPNVDYKGPKGDIGATGAQGPNDEIELTVTDDVNENRPIVFASTAAGTGTIPLQTEPGIVHFNPIKNELYGQNIFSPLTSTASQFPLIARSNVNGSIVQFERIFTTDGFYADFENTALNEINVILTLNMNLFAKIHLQFAVTTDSNGSIFEEVIAYSNYDGTVNLYDAFGNPKGANTIGTVAPAGGNPSYSLATLIDGTEINFAIYSLIDSTITGKAHFVLDYVDAVTL